MRSLQGHQSIQAILPSQGRSDDPPRRWLARRAHCRDRDCVVIHPLHCVQIFVATQPVNRKAILGHSNGCGIARFSRSKNPPVCVLRLVGGWDMYPVDIYNRVRGACLKDGMSARETARYFNKDRKTFAQMLRHELPPGYARCGKAGLVRLHRDVLTRLASTQSTVCCRPLSMKSNKAK